MPRTRGGLRPSAFDGRHGQWRQGQRRDHSITLNTPPVKNQGSAVDCCASMAVVTAMEILDSRSASAQLLSPLYNYFIARPRRRQLGMISITDAIEAAANYGTCLMELHDPPFTVDGALDPPNSQAIENAPTHRIQRYDPATMGSGFVNLDIGSRVNNWREALSHEIPIVIGFFPQSAYWNGNGIPSVLRERNRKPHSVCIVGFDDDQQAFLALDSRGPGFASEGFWSLHYNVLNTRLVFESWAIQLLTYDY